MIMIICGVFEGVCRSFASMVDHGLCSSVLFCLSDVCYESVLAEEVF